MKLIKENVGLAKVSKEDQGVVDNVYASAIRDLEKADKLEDETTKTQPEEKHNEKPKNPKMVKGAKRLHLDESLFEFIDDEDAEQTEFALVAYEDGSAEFADNDNAWQEVEALNDMDDEDAEYAGIVGWVVITKGADGKYAIDELEKLGGKLEDVITYTNLPNAQEIANNAITKYLAELNGTNESFSGPRGLKESRLVETGEWEDDEEGLAWKEYLVDLVREYTGYNVDIDDASGFDRYQGPSLYVDGKEFWTDGENEGSLLCKYEKFGIKWYRISSKEDFQNMMEGTLSPLTEKVAQKKAERLTELNDRQLRAERDALRNAGQGFVRGEYHRGTPEQQKRETELDCIDMINSILAYDCSNAKTGEEVVAYQERAYHNYFADYIKELGRERVVELAQEQLDSIEGVDTGVYTDSEGCSYNSIKWKNESVKSRKSRKLNEGTSNFGHLDNFPLLVFYTIDEVDEQMKYDDEYPNEDDFEDEDAYWDAREKFEQDYYDKLKVCVLSDDEWHNLEEDLEDFNSATVSCAEDLYDTNEDDYFELKDIKLKLEPGYYEAAYIACDDEEGFNYLSETTKNAQLARFNEFFKSIKDKYGLTELSLAYRFSNGETGYSIKTESVNRVRKATAKSRNRK